MTPKSKAQWEAEDRETGKAIRAICDHLQFWRYCTARCQRRRCCSIGADEINAERLPPVQRRLMQSGLAPPCAAVNWDLAQPLICAAITTIIPAGIAPLFLARLIFFPAILAVLCAAFFAALSLILAALLFTGLLALL